MTGAVIHLHAIASISKIYKNSLKPINNSLEPSVANFLHLAGAGIQLHPMAAIPGIYKNSI